MVSTNDMRPGQSIIVDNILYQILEYQHVKPGKGKAFVKTKLKNLSNGGNIEKTFHYFMNNESFEQISIDRSVLDGQEILLKPNEEVTIAMHENNPIDIILPTTVTLQVTKSEPAVKGDSVNSSTKEVTCETGFTLQVPMFIEENEFIKIDTKTYTYITRA